MTDWSDDDKKKKAGTAKGDVKAYRGRGGGGGGGGGWPEYDDEGRGLSKSIYEEFAQRFEYVDYDCSSLFEVTGYNAWKLIAKTTFRYNIKDGPKYYDRNDYNDREPGWLEKRMRSDTSRIAQLVKKHCGEDTWLSFYNHILDEYTKYRNEQARIKRERDLELDAKWKSQQEAADAKRLVVLQEETRSMREEVELTAGMLRSDFDEALRMREVYGVRDGEWIDDVVGACTTGYGFAEEIQERSGVKLQVTVSLDCSNSMYHNHIANDAVTAFRTIYMALEALQAEHQGDVYIQAFVFSRWADGKGANTADSAGNPIYHIPDEYRLGVMDRYRNDVSVSALFNGEDTWVYPLFEKIEAWENKNSDPGAIRLDIVITDAVLEHTSDIRQSSVIQERRNGALQTVFLNLMPEERWINSTLPQRCLQYPANKDNLGGLLRNLLAEFVSVNV